MRQYYGYIFIISAALCWSLIGPLSRFCLQSGVSPIEIAFWRSFLGGVLFLLCAWREGSSRIVSAKDAGLFLLFGIFGIGGLFACIITVVEEGGAALASVLLYTAPAWVAVFSRLIFREELTYTKLGAIAISLSGVICISFSGNSTGGVLTWRVLILGLMTGVFYSSHYIFTKEFLKRYKPMTIYGIAMGVSALTLFPFVSFVEKSMADWGVLCFLGGVSSFLSYWVYCLSMKYLQPTRAAILATLEPCFATFFAWWWWGEDFSLLGWLGAMFIVSAVVVLILEKREKTENEVSAA